MTAFLVQQPAYRYPSYRSRIKKTYEVKQSLGVGKDRARVQSSLSQRDLTAVNTLIRPYNQILMGLDRHARAPAYFSLRQAPAIDADNLISGLLPPIHGASGSVDVLRHQKKPWLAPVAPSVDPHYRLVI